MSIAARYVPLGGNAPDFSQVVCQHCPHGLIGQQPAAQLPWFHILYFVADKATAEANEATTMLMELLFGSYRQRVLSLLLLHPDSSY